VPRNQPCPGGGRWLRKPLRSSAGRGIRFAAPGEPADPAYYFQEFIEGEPASAVFVGPRLIDATVQLIGLPWLHAKPFGYCGNIGPLRLPEQTDGSLVVLGLEAAGEFGLREVWGADFILRADSGLPALVEINPRYTAGVEVLEHATGGAVW